MGCCYKNELRQFILHKMILRQNHFSLNPLMISNIEHSISKCEASAQNFIIGHSYAEP